MSSPRILVVGAGFFGLTIAERVANDLKMEVTLIDRRDHAGGNSYSYIHDETGIEVHKYGIHIFHTSNDRVWEYVNRFTTFNSYRHHVFSTHSAQTYSMPISLHTISHFYGRSFSPQEAKNFLEKRGRGSFPAPNNLEEKAVDSFGWDLYEALVRGYTLKQWQTSPRDLPPTVVGRLPVRFDMNTRYFDDTYEGIPSDGYFKWQQNMISSPRIDVQLRTDYFSERGKFRDFDLVVFTGPIDEFFDWKYGQLGWRTLDFETETIPLKDFQGCSQMNYADESEPQTRILEFRHLHPERNYPSDRTVIVKEFSRAAVKKDEKYYPINSQADREILARYRDEASLLRNTIFGGRLGSYQYLDMHMAIASALQTYENKIRPRLSGN